MKEGEVVFAKTFATETEEGAKDIFHGEPHTRPTVLPEVLHKQDPNDKVTLGIHYYVTAAGIAFIRLR